MYANKVHIFAVALKSIDVLSSYVVVNQLTVYCLRITNDPVAIYNIYKQKHYKI